MTKHFDIRKSPVDGKLRIWEQHSALRLGFITQADIDTGDVVNSLVWVCVAVHRARREVFKR